VAEQPELKWKLACRHPVSLVVICQMKLFVPIAVLFFSAGCNPAEPTSQLAQAQDASPPLESTTYVVFSVPPDPMLDKMLSLYTPDNPEWPRIVDEFVKNGHPILRHAIRQLAEDQKVSPETAQKIYNRMVHSAAVALDGQRVLSLMETACYADVTCHRIEYPLRVATLDYVRDNVDSQGVQDTLNWIRNSYRSGLPLDSHGDDAGDFRGLLVESMQIRLTAYANELLMRVKKSK
jgi:hypothetical protein